MRVTFHPKRLLITVLFLVALGTVPLAMHSREGAVACGVAVLAYLAFVLFFSVNPATWPRERRNHG